MAKLTRIELLESVRSAIHESDWHVAILDSQKPFQLLVHRDEQSYRVRVYIWNITHGGGAQRPSNEYRIQVTGTNQFIQNPSEKTLILGWWDEVGVFAGFDYSKHSGILGSSPSFQIRQDCLEDAYRNGFAPCEKENQEIAVTFRADFMAEYIQNLETLHTFGAIQSDFDMLQRVAAESSTIDESELEIVTLERRESVYSVRRKLRSSSFRSRVLAAYERQCAFCGLQLNLVQAAHIIPVSHDDSNDETYNGIAACHLHHAAYDQGLITFDETFRIIINEDQFASFQANNLAGGSDEFRSGLRPLIVLPPAHNDRPRAELVQIANNLRRWSL
jgi:putative restriction endonuclease